MKNVLKAFLLLICIFPAISGHAQSNFIKTGVSGFLLGDYNLGYERETFENQSVQLKIGYFQPTLSPFISEATITPSEYTFQNITGKIQTSVEYRFYMAREGLQGFYVAPYARYYGVQADYIDYIRDDLFDVEAYVNTIGLGFQLGYNILLGEVFSLDISFFGAGLDRNSLKLIYTTNTGGFNYSSIVNDVGEVFEEIPYLKNRIESEVNPGNLITRIPFLFPGLRASFSIGVAF